MLTSAPWPPVWRLTVSPASSAVGSMSRSAPCAAASSRRLAIGSEHATQPAPCSRASCAAISPIAPRPVTSTRSPTRMPESWMPQSATDAGSQHSSASGAVPAGTACNTSSATVCVSRTGSGPNTRSPSRKRSAPGPASTTRATPWLPSGSGKASRRSPGRCSPSSRSNGTVVSRVSARKARSSVPCLTTDRTLRRRTWPGPRSGSRYSTRAGVRGAVATSACGMASILALAAACVRPAARAHPPWPRRPKSLARIFR